MEKDKLDTMTLSAVEAGSDIVELLYVTWTSSGPLGDLMINGKEVDVPCNIPRRPNNLRDFIRDNHDNHIRMIIAWSKVYYPQTF